MKRMKWLAATVVATGLGFAGFGAASAGSVPHAGQEGTPLVVACHEQGRAADFAYWDYGTGELVCVVASETNVSGGNPSKGNMDGKGNGRYVKAGAGKGNPS